jgi:hypothetical protein
MTRQGGRALGTILAAALMVGCGGEGPPTPGELKTLATVCDKANDGKRMAVEGHLSLLDSFSERSSSQSAPLLIRATPQDTADQIFVWMPYGTGPNSMDKLPAQYSAADLKVRTKDGATVGAQNRVRISGTVVFPSQSPVPAAKCGFNAPLVESA